MKYMQDLITKLLLQNLQLIYEISLVVEKMLSSVFFKSSELFHTVLLLRMTDPISWAQVLMVSKLSHKKIDNWGAYCRITIWSKSLLEFYLRADKELIR